MSAFAVAPVGLPSRNGGFVQRSSAVSLKPRPALQQLRKTFEHASPSSSRPQFEYARAEKKGFGPKKKKIEDKAAEAPEEYGAAASPEPVQAARERAPYQGLPPVVADRMLKRMLSFAAPPLVLGLSSFPMYYLLIKKFNIEFEPVLPFATSSFCFGFAMVGISYGLLSASWEPKILGSWHGFEQFQKNSSMLPQMVKEFFAQQPLRDQDLD
eukprot:tig00021759_g23427.t1